MTPLTIESFRVTTGPIPQIRKLRDTEKRHSKYKTQEVDSLTDIRSVLTDFYWFCDCVSCVTRWPQTHCVAEIDIEFPTFLPPLSKHLISVVLEMNLRLSAF